MARITTNVTTIQCWPGGESFTFRGSPDGPANQRSIRTPVGWRKGTDEEWRTIHTAILAERYAAHEILCCDSSLVDDLIKMAGRGELGASPETRGLAEAFEIDQIENLYPNGIANDDDDDAREVFEWWRVSEWLCIELRRIGEIVIDNGYGRWWGRTTTGQSLLMDGVLQKIAAGRVG